MKVRTILGILMTVVGVGFYGAGYVVLSQSLDKQRAQEETLRRTEAACREQLVKLGRVTPSTGGVVEVDFGEVKGDPRRALADVTAALAMCPGRALVDTCLGVGCGTVAGAPGAIRLTVRLSLGAAAPRKS